MNEDTELLKAADKYAQEAFLHGDAAYTEIELAFIAGAKWAERLRLHLGPDVPTDTGTIHQIIPGTREYK